MSEEIIFILLTGMRFKISLLKTCIQIKINHLLLYNIYKISVFSHSDIDAFNYIFLCKLCTNDCYLFYDLSYFRKRKRYYYYHISLIFI